MTDKIPATIARAIDAVDQSEEIAAVDAKVDAAAALVEEAKAKVDEATGEHSTRLDALEAKVKHLMKALGHIMPPFKD